MRIYLAAIMSIGLLFSIAGPSQAAVSFSLGGAPAGDGSGLTSNYSWAHIEDFSSGMPSNYSGDGQVVNGTAAGLYTAPPGDSTDYLSVPDPSGRTTRTLTIDASAGYNYFGLYWGSIDDYNSIQFYANNNVVATYWGDDIFNPANGNQTANGAAYVNFDFDGNDFYDKIELSSSGYAFESDNHAFLDLPAPAATLAIFGLGLFGMWFGIRRRQKNT